MEEAEEMLGMFEEVMTVNTEVTSKVFTNNVFSNKNNNNNNRALRTSS